ncbi:PilZ domain-containing protein [Cohnella fermenti]|nr:PilZ domain-containing protein [Cohnella fermenti]
MSISRRHEPFRYEFQPPLPCLIQLYEVNNARLDSKQGQARLLDLSPNGCKLDTPLNFRVNQNECKVVLSFDLIGPLAIRGSILWQDQKAHTSHYGIQFEEDHQKEITDELKHYAKKHREELAGQES